VVASGVGGRAEAKNTLKNGPTGRGTGWSK
jgi:hypothetical protein